MKAIILAAGYATRMQEKYPNTPKPLLPIGGRPIIDFIVDQLNGVLAVDEIFVVTNAKFYENFTAWQPASRVPVRVLNDSTTAVENRLGAIGDILFVLQSQKISQDIVVVAGDNYLEYPLAAQYAFFQKTGCDTLCAMRMADVERLKGFAVAELDAHGKVLSLEEKPAQPKSDIAIFATYFYRAETLPLFEVYKAAHAGEQKKMDAPGQFPQWLYTQKDVYAYTMEGQCHDLGTIDSYQSMKVQMEK